MYLLHNCRTNITSETNLKEILGTRIPYAQTEQLSNGLFPKKITIWGGDVKFWQFDIALESWQTAQMPPGKSTKINSLWPGIMCLCKVMNGRMFFSSDHLENIQGGHIFKRLNSLSFPWDFQGIFKFFPEQLKREKFAAIHFYLRLCYIFYVFPEFSRFFLQKFKFPWVFPEILTIFQISWVFQVCGYPDIT